MDSTLLQPGTLSFTEILRGTRERLCLLPTPTLFDSRLHALKTHTHTYTHHSTIRTKAHQYPLVPPFLLINIPVHSRHSDRILYISALHRQVICCRCHHRLELLQHKKWCALKGKGSKKKTNASKNPISHTLHLNGLTRLRPHVIGTSFNKLHHALISQK